MSRRRRDESNRPKPKPARDADPSASAGDAHPTPARDLLGASDGGADAPVAVPDERTFEAGDSTWTARVQGQTRMGSHSGAAGLLLLAFRHAEAKEPELESLVVGNSLEELTTDALRAALSTGRAPPPPGSRKEIFPEVGGRNRSRDG